MATAQSRLSASTGVIAFAFATTRARTGQATAYVIFFVYANGFVVAILAIPLTWHPILSIAITASGGLAGYCAFCG